MANQGSEILHQRKIDIEIHNRDMHAKVCHGKRGLCKEMVPIDGSELLKYLRKVEFEGEKYIASSFE